MLTLITIYLLQNHFTIYQQLICSLINNQPKESEEDDDSEEANMLDEN